MEHCKHVTSYNWHEFYSNSLPAILASAWVFLSFFTANAAYGFQWDRFLIYTGAQSLFAVTLVAACTKLISSRYSRGVALSIGAACILIFQYENVGNVLLLGGIFSVKLQLTLWALLSAMLMLLFIFYAGGDGIYRAFVTALVVMLGVNVIQLTITFFETRDYAVSSEKARERAFDAQGRRPVISLVLDTYAHSSVLKSLYGYDNQGFEHALAERDFRIIPNAFSNYPWTSLSMSSTLEMSYPVEAGGSNPYDSLKSAETINGLNATVRKFRDLGYAYGIFHTGRFYSTIGCSGYEDYCLQCAGKFGEAEFVLFEKTPFAHLLRKFFPEVYASLSADSCPITLIDEKSLAMGDVPFFLMAHHMALHQPSNVDSDCAPLATPISEIWPPRSATPQLRMQIDCMNRQTLELVDGLIARLGDPIILISGDHGIWIDSYHEGDTVALKNRHSIFTAIRLPRSCKDLIPETLTSVNQYRLIFACIEKRSSDFIADRIFAVKALDPGNPRTPIRVQEVELKNWRIK